MRIIFNKIPNQACWLYGIGFFIVIGSMLTFLILPGLVNTQTLQQLFILGSIIVTLGSVINTLHQFKPKKTQKKE